MAPTTSILGSVRDWLRDAARVPDSELLARFIASRDGEAFAVMLDRHGPMVWGVCRRVLGDRHAAEDAFQATFLVLARKARTVRRPNSLGAWLHGVAHRLAVRAARRERHRRVAESTRSASPQTETLDELSARELLAVLDQEIQRLPERDREPLVLCCLEGLSLDEAAARLGVAAGAIKGRLERGRSRLRANLTKRGFVVPAVLGTGLLLTPSAVARPLVESTIAICLGRDSCPAALAALAASAARVRIWAIALPVMISLGVALLTLTKTDTPAQPPGNPPKKSEPEQLPPGVVARLGVPRLPLRSPIAFAPDGRTFLGVSGDTVIRYDASTGELIEQKTFPGLTGVPALSADGRRVLAIGATEIQAWDIGSKRQLFTAAFPARFYASELSPDGKKLAAVSRVQGKRPTYKLSIWDLDANSERILQAENAVRNGLLFTPDGKHLLTWTTELVCWDLVRNRIEWTAKGSCDRIVLSQDGGMLLRYDASARKWSAINSATGDSIAGLKLPSEYPYSRPALAADHRTFVLPTKRGVVLWDMMDGKERCVLPRTERNTVYGASFLGSFAPDGKSILVNFGVVHRYDLATGRPNWPDSTALGHTARPTTLAFSADGKWLASGSYEDQSIRIWDTKTGRLVHSLFGHTSYVRKVEFTQDGRRLVSGGGDSTVRVWEVATGRQLHALHLHDGRNRDEHQQVGSIRISPDGRGVTVTAIEGFRGGPIDDHVVSNWDIIEGKRIDQSRHLTLKSFDGVIDRPITADGRAILLDSGRFVDLAGIPLRPPAALMGDEHMYNVHFTQDERLGAGVSRRPGNSGWVVAVLLWEIATGKPVARIPMKEIDRLAFTKPGTNLVTISRSEIQNWDLRTVKVVRSHPVSQTAARLWSVCLAVSPDGKTAATGHDDGTILLWDIAPLESTPAPLMANERDKFWADLAGSDAAKAFAAVCRFAEDPNQSLPFLKEKLQATQRPTVAEVKKLLAELQSPVFKTREAAETKLRSFPNLDESPLREALKADPPAEARKRIEAILASLSPAVAPQGEALRGVRAVWVLERIGTPEARKLLESLAVGDLRLAREAKAALERSEPRNKNKLIK